MIMKTNQVCKTKKKKNLSENVCIPPEYTFPVTLGYVTLADLCLACFGLRLMSVM